MLVLKKISIKKLAIYISIIVLTLGGAGFMLYQNKKSANQPPVADDQARPDELIAPQEPLASPLKAEAEPSQPIQADKIKNNKAFNLTIFSSEKFKELKKNALINQESLILGKKNPFKPN